ncbi:MAG: hypothetical protein U0U09_18625 [Cyclobacteriaceae bacterium]
MIQFTTEFLASWRLEGYQFILIHEYNMRFGYLTVHPSQEELPEKLKVMFRADSFPIYAPLMDRIASGDHRDGLRYYVSDSYDLYRNYDEEHIDMEADF